MAGHVEVGRIRGHPSPFLYTLLYRLAKVFSTHAKQYWSRYFAGILYYPSGLCSQLQKHNLYSLIV